MNTILARSNPYYEVGYQEAHVYTEDSPLLERVLATYLLFRAENILALGVDPWEAEQQAFEDAVDSPRNGIVAGIYPPAFEKYLQYKGISRKVFQHIDPKLPGRKQHGA